MQSSFVPRVKGRETYGTSLVVQRLGLHALTAVAQVQSLVRELKSCKLYSTVKKKRKGGQRDLESGQESRCSTKAKGGQKETIYSWTCSEEEGRSHNSFSQWVKHGCIQLTCLRLAITFIFICLFGCARS